MNMMDVLKIVLIIQLFWGTCMTMVVYAMPDDALTHAQLFAYNLDDIDADATLNEVQDNLEQQRDMPLIELGALVFYSGNILIDLLLNSITALPQMIEIVIGGVMLLLNVDGYVIGTIQIFTTTIWGLIYVLSIIEMLISLRGRGTLV